jgi:hypothetical protein
VFSSFLSETLYVEVGVSEDNGGTAILDYELWRDEGDDYQSSFTIVGNYDGQGVIDDLTVADDGVVSGKIYRFKSRARNNVGYSDYSLISYIAFGDVSPAPGQP